MRMIDVINKLSISRMEYQTSTGSVLDSFVVPFFIERFDLRKISQSVALVGSRGSGKSTYIQYFSHHTRFDRKKSKVDTNEFECVILYWKPDISYCQGLKENWLGAASNQFFCIHAAISLLSELNTLLKNCSYHCPSILQGLNSRERFWKSISRVVGENINSFNDVDEWISDYRYEVSTRLNPINTDGLISVEPKQMLMYLIDSIKHDCPEFSSTVFKVFIDEFELLNPNQQRLINTYRKESYADLVWNVAYKLNSSLTNETSSDQWLQSPDDYTEYNLDKFIAEDYKFLAAEIFLLTLQNAGLDSEIKEFCPSFLGSKDNVERRKSSDYQKKLLNAVRRLLPNPSISELSKIAVGSNSVESKVRKVLNESNFSEGAIKSILDNPSLAVTILGVHKQNGFNKDAFEKYSLGLLPESEERSVINKIHTYEFNTLLSLNLQNSTVKIPVYSGFDRYITMTQPNVRHFKQLCLSALSNSNRLEDSDDYVYMDQIPPISLVDMHFSAIKTSSSLVKEVRSYPPYGNNFDRLVNRMGELFRISQKSSYQSEPERSIFTFDYDYAGSDPGLEELLASALSWRVIVESDARRIKDDMQITSKEYQLNPIYAPKFGISFRKKRGIYISLDDFNDICSSSADKFSEIKNSFQKKWRIVDEGSRQEGLF